MPILNGNTWIEFTYGGSTYVLPYVNITSYEQKPVFAEDGFTMIRYEVSIQGTALVSDGTATFTDLASKFKNITGTVDSFTLYVKEGVNTTQVISVAFPDSMRGPYMELSVTEMNGRRACVVSFSAHASITLSGSNNSVNPAYPVVAHRWVTRMSLDGSGCITRTVTGSLTVNLAATGNSQVVAQNGTFSEINGKSPWADLFRKAVAPAMPSGTWRRDSQTFAYNEAGNTLIYEFVDSQARTALPDGAYIGNAEFTYERTRQNLAMATLRFSCELEGSAEGDSKQLIYAAVVIAQGRIPFTKSIINRITVTESEMLKKAKIRLEVEALAPANNSTTPSTSVASIPLVELIGSNFSVSRTCPVAPDPYGSTDTKWFAYPHWEGNTATAKPNGIDSTLPASQMIAYAVTECAGTATAVTILSSPTNFNAANSLIVTGSSTPPSAELDAFGNAKSVERQITFTKVNTKTNMHRLQTLYTQGADFVFQTGKASVVIEESTTVKRQNQPPNRVMRPLPPGFVVLKDDWTVNFGDMDPSGNRVYTGIYTRTLLSYDGGGATFFGYYTNAGIRQWWNTSVAAPMTLGFDQNNQQPTSNVFAVTGTQAYSTGSAQNYA
jgi:hypothetical protein